jgi:hypothetical protein
MKRLLAAAALMTLAIAGAASGGHASAAGTVSSTRLVDGGRLRVTVTIATPVQVGSPLTGTFRVKNVSKVTRKLPSLDYPTTLPLVIHSPDGTTYDTQTAYWSTGSLGGPVLPPVRIRPGKTVTRSLFAPPVRWSGPLRITPSWAGTALPTLHVAVTPPGTRPTAKAAMADVVASTGHLLDGCTPTTPGVAVTGKLVAPKHSAPALRVACSISLHREPGFYRAQVLVVSPPGLRGVHLERPYEQLAYLKSGQNATAVGWLFVVTRSGAISVGATSVDSTKSAHRMAPDWQWTTSGFQHQPGGSRCGGWGGGGGGYGGPLIDFVSKCR